MSTSNRFLRASERLRTIAEVLDEPHTKAEWAEVLTRQISRLERQSVYLLNALRGAYVALGSFAVASLVSIVGAGITSGLTSAYWSYPFILSAFLVGFLGAGSLVTACIYLFKATRLSVQNISEEAAYLKQREANRAQLRAHQALSAVG